MCRPKSASADAFIATANLSDTERPGGGNKSEAALDIADSSILISASKYMFSAGDYGYAVLGPDTTGRRFRPAGRNFCASGAGRHGQSGLRLRACRTRLPNTLVSFPTIRDDDLLGFTHVGNAGANVEAEEDQIFGGRSRRHALSVEAFPGARLRHRPGGDGFDRSHQQ